MQRTCLVVNADDFGLTDGVCRGIVAAHEHGIVTSTSVLTVAPAFRRGAPMLRDLAMGVGLHLCVVGEDPPLLGQREIPSLLDRSGRFALTWTAFCRWAAMGRIDPDDLRSEFEAQLEATRHADLVLDHLDSHQNLMLWPAFRDEALRLAQEHGIPLVRVAGTERWGPKGVAVRTLGRRARRAAADCGLIVPDKSYGLDTAGRADLPTLIRLVQSSERLGGVVDLGVHPGSRDDPERVRYRWNYRWAEELDALCRPELANAIEQAGLTLATFADVADIRRSR